MVDSNLMWSCPRPRSSRSRWAASVVPRQALRRHSCRLYLAKVLDSEVEAVLSDGEQDSVVGGAVAPSQVVVVQPAPPHRRSRPRVGQGPHPKWIVPPIACAGSLRHEWRRRGGEIDEGMVETLVVRYHSCHESSTEAGPPQNWLMIPAIANGWA